jgi:hypothetical protein
MWAPSITRVFDGGTIVPIRITISRVATPFRVLSHWIASTSVPAPGAVAPTLSSAIDALPCMDDVPAVDPTGESSESMPDTLWPARGPDVATSVSA